MNQMNSMIKNFQAGKNLQNIEVARYTLSTEDLTDLCLRYPLLWDFYAFNNTNDGLDKLSYQLIK